MKYKDKYDKESKQRKNPRRDGRQILYDLRVRSWNREI
jgi:hypothetical protein